MNDLRQRMPLLDFEPSTNGVRRDPGDEPTVSAADPTVTVQQFVARTPEDGAEPLVTCEQGTLAPARSLILYAAKASAGKTTHAIDLALHGAAGEECCGLSFPRPLRILIVENEGPREGFRAKLEARLAHGPAGEPIRIWDDYDRWGTVRISDEEVRAQLRKVIDRHRIDVVISDSLTRFGMSGNGTPEETRDFMLLLADAGLGTRAAFLILAHTRTRTDNERDELEQLAGAWAPHADAILMLRKLGGNRARLSYPKTRWTRGEVPAVVLAFDPETERFSVVAREDEDAAPVTSETYDQRVLDWLAEHPSAKTEDLDAGVTGRGEEVRAARNRLKRAGRVKVTPSGELGLPGKGMRWNLAPEAGFSPVPLPGTEQDESTSEPLQDRQPRPAVPTKEGTEGGTGLADGDAPSDTHEELDRA